LIQLDLIAYARPMPGAAHQGANAMARQLRDFSSGALGTDAQQGTILLSPMLKEGPTNSSDENGKLTSKH
jgi:hypothetical protein